MLKTRKELGRGGLSYCCLFVLGLGVGTIWLLEKSIGPKFLVSFFDLKSREVQLTEKPKLFVSCSLNFRIKSSTGPSSCPHIPLRHFN